MYKITVTRAVPTVILKPKNHGRACKAKPKLMCTKLGYIRLGLVLAHIKKKNVSSEGLLQTSFRKYVTGTL